MRTRHVHEQLRGAHRRSCSLAQMSAVRSLVEELWARKLGAAVAAAEVPVSGVEAAIAQLRARCARSVQTQNSLNESVESPLIHEWIGRPAAARGSTATSAG